MLLVDNKLLNFLYYKYVWHRNITHGTGTTVCLGYVLPSTVLVSVIFIRFWLTCSREDLLSIRELTL